MATDINLIPVQNSIQNSIPTQHKIQIPTQIPTQIQKFKIKLRDQYIEKEERRINEKEIEMKKKIEIETQKIEEFKLLPKYKQGTQEWKDQRNDYLTASTICSAIGEAGKQQRKHLLIEKGSRGKQSYFSGNNATQHGNKCEPIANAIYSHKNNVFIEEFGLITNPKYPILGVSPDGIMLDKMLEIKCPYSRKINGKVKKEYYHQMQEQMVVCEYDSCDFLECKITIFDENNDIDKNFWNIYNDIEYKGAIILYIDSDNEQKKECEFKYSYSKVIGQSPEELQEWIKNERENRTVVFVQYWILDVYNCQNVKRDPEWIIKYYPILQQFWDEVINLRENGIEPSMLIDSEDSDVDDMCTQISSIRIGSACLL